MTPAEIVSKMLQKDKFSAWLGIELLEISAGACTLKCTVHEEMLNGFEILHGGISYSLADSALAFASNAYGFQAVSIETSISHTKSAKLGDVLTAKCTELHRGKTIGIYQVEVKNQLDTCIALFKGTVHISARTWE